jgi:hypothetical protein
LRCFAASRQPGTLAEILLAPRRSPQLYSAASRLVTTVDALRNDPSLTGEDCGEMSSIQARKDEILAKKAKLAELKRNRELRQREFSNTRQSLDATEV